MSPFSQSDVSSGAVGSVPFVGRRTHLSTIVRIAREVLAGTSGVVSIEGEAGIGKTALAHRAPGELDDGFLVLRAVCDPSEQDLAFEVVAQLVAEVPVSTMRAFPLDKIGANRA